MRYRTLASPVLLMLVVMAFQPVHAFAESSSNRALALPSYEIIPVLAMDKTVIGHPVVTWEALKIDRAKNAIELCVANLGEPISPALFAACSPLRYAGVAVNLAVSSVTTIPMQLTNTRAQEFWAINLDTGQVTFCYGTCVNAKEVRDAKQPKD